MRNIWENRKYGFTEKVKAFKKDRDEEIDQLIDLACNFLKIIDESKFRRVKKLTIEETPYGVIHHSKWSISASTFLQPDQGSAMVGIVKRVVALAKAKNFCAEIIDCSPRMKDIFWIEAQSEGLQILNFKPSELLVNRLEKRRQFKQKMEERAKLSKEQTGRLNEGYINNAI